MSTTRPTRFARVRRWAALLTMAGTAVLVHAAVVAPAEARSYVDRAPMQMAAHSAKVLDVPGGSHQAGAQLIQWAPHGGNNQRFRPLTFGNPPTGPNDIRLVILLSTESGHVLDVSGSAEVASVVQNPWSGSASQVWWAAPFGNTGYTLYVNMGSGKVITVAGASLSDGAPVVQGTWNGGLNQLWATMDFMT